VASLLLIPKDSARFLLNQSRIAPLVRNRARDRSALDRRDVLPTRPPRRPYVLRPIHHTRRRGLRARDFLRVSSAMEVERRTLIVRKRICGLRPQSPGLARELPRVD
jgi:hypothetical protein